MSYNRAAFVHELLQSVGLKSAPLVDDEEVPALPFCSYTQTALVERQLHDYTGAFVTTFELRLFTETYSEGWDLLSALYEAVARAQEDNKTSGRYLHVDSLGDDTIFRTEGSEKAGFSFNMTLAIQ